LKNNLQDELVGQYSRGLLPIEDVLFMLKRDLDELDLYVERSTPTWTREERLDLRKILLSYQQATENQYAITQQWRYEISIWWTMTA
jgi:hypothetical protein